MSAVRLAARKVQVRMPAKINLALRVGPLRDDGYHDLATVFQAVSLYDIVTVIEGAAGSGISMRCDTEGVPLDAGNIAWRAAELMGREAGRGADIVIDLNKGIPTAGGMGGGSADGAGVLLGLNELWKLGLSRERLQELAIQLGSDVPFCVGGGTQLGAGRGELLSPVLSRASYHWVIATSDDGLSTPEVYDELDRMRPHAEEPSVDEAVMTALRSGDSRALGRALVNDLQAPALRLRPALKRTLDAGIELGALGALVSGSGPTCLFLAKDDEHALDLQVSLTAAGLAHDVVRAQGPVRPHVM